MDEDRKTPSKPKPTTATVEQLAAHYNSQVDAYNKAVTGLPADKRKDVPLQAVLVGWDLEVLPPPEINTTVQDVTTISKEELVELIRRQNHRLGRHIKARSHELLLHHLTDDQGAAVLKDGKYTVGYTYAQILDILAAEFPEASTSVACLRWYVVHMRSDARDEGKPWPPLPQVRPRSAAAKREAA